MRREKQVSAMVNKLLKEISITNRKNALIIEKMMTSIDEESLMLHLSFVLEKMKDVCANKKYYML